MERENLFGGVVLGILISIVIGAITVFIFTPGFSSIIFILSLAVLPGFFIMSLLYFWRLSKEKMIRGSYGEKFDWGVEVNLRRLQIIHHRYSVMLQTAGIMAIGAFLGMVYIGSAFPYWMTGHKILFPIATLIFIFSLHFAFRWWFSMREHYDYLRFTKIKK